MLGSIWYHALMYWAPAARACLCVLGLAAVAQAEGEGSVPFPLGLRVRGANPDKGTAVEAAFAATFSFSADRTSLAVDCIASIGGDGSNTTGTFDYLLTLGRLYSRGEHPTTGLVLRGGGAVVVDSFGSFKASYLALPMAQVGFAHAGALGQLDVGVQVAPTLAGRLQSGSAVRWLGLGGMAGPYLNLLTPIASFHVEANHLLVSTHEGRAADWARGMLCVSINYFDVCSDGMLIHFGDATAGYVGAMLGVNVAKVGQMFVPSVR